LITRIHPLRYKALIPGLGRDLLCPPDVVVADHHALQPRALRIDSPGKHGDGFAHSPGTDKQYVHFSS